MFLGTHILFYSSEPTADRAFLRDVLGLNFVDTGGGWMIFGMPSCEAGVHPMEGPRMPQVSAGAGLLNAHIYLMCEDLEATMMELAGRGASFTDVAEEQWGKNTTMRLPSGGQLGLYQPYHPTALDL